MEFENQYIKITDEYKDMYDKAAAVWLQVKEAVDECRDKGLTSKELSKVGPVHLPGCTSACHKVKSTLAHCKQSRRMPSSTALGGLYCVVVFCGMQAHDAT